MARGPRNGSVYRRWAKAVVDRATHCGICGGPLQKGIYKYPHPLSAVADHIVDLQHGGDLLDPNNGQGAHKVCNERKNKGRLRRARRTPTVAPGQPVHSREW